MVRRALKLLGRAFLALVVLLGIAIAGALEFRAHLQHETVLATQIASAHGISEASFVDIGGLPQWVQIRGDDIANPVLLFVHGGPAVSMIPFTLRSMRPWEKSFTIVQWDQRGAGRTYFRNGAASSTASGMSQIVDDGLRVSEYVRAHLHTDKLIVMGESFGSAIALEMVRLRPELFYAYVGTGQSVDMPRAAKLTYQVLLQRLSAAHDNESVQKLTAIGPPPYGTPEASAIEQQILGKYLAASEHEDLWGRDFLFAPGYSLLEVYEIVAGLTQHPSALAKEAAQYTALAHGTQFSVPLFFFEGTEDIVAPKELVSEYIAQISAPAKELVLFQGGGHHAFHVQSEPFLQELLKRVRPLAVSEPHPDSLTPPAYQQALTGPGQE